MFFVQWVWVDYPSVARSVSGSRRMRLCVKPHPTNPTKANKPTNKPPPHTNGPQVKKLQEEKFKPLEQLTLEPYERDHAVVVATYRPIPKAKK